MRLASSSISTLRLTLIFSVTGLSPLFAVQYKQVLDARGNISASSVFRVDDNATIPADPENRDYKAFLAWQKAGNSILPADPRPIDTHAADKSILKDSRATTDDKLNALIKVLDLDK